MNGHWLPVLKPETINGLLCLSRLHPSSWVLMLLEGFVTWGTFAGMTMVCFSWVSQKSQRQTSPMTHNNVLCLLLLQLDVWVSLCMNWFEGKSVRGRFMHMMLKANNESQRSFSPYGPSFFVCSRFFLHHFHIVCVLLSSQTSVLAATWTELPSLII